jgi:plasmid stabilization system protein ParE
MGLKVYWTDFAKKELNKIFDFLYESVNLKTAKQITLQIIEKTDSLVSFPEMGATEQLLTDRPQIFRYLLSTNYKIIYWVNSQKKRIEIVDVFDTRQNPVKVKRNK